MIDIEKDNEERKIKESLMKKLSQRWRCCSQKYSMMTNIMTTMTIMSEVGEPHIHHMLYILQIKPEVGPRKKYLNFQQSQSNSQADMRTSAVIENITRNNATTNFFNLYFHTRK